MIDFYGFLWYNKNIKTKMKGMIILKPTNDIILQDATQVLNGDYIIAGVFIFAALLILGVFIFFLVKSFLNRNFFKEHFGNTIALAAFSVVGVAILFGHIQGSIIPLKEQIALNNWEIKEDYCVSKASGAIPNVEDYQVRFEIAGTKRVSQEVYKKVDEGFKHYIVKLKNGDELIYSSK